MTRRLAAALALIAAAGAAPAGVPDAVEDHVLPGMDRFAEASAALSETALADCRAAALRPAYHAAFDAWLGVGHLRFGPFEEDGRALAIAFWPDTRGMVARSTDALIADADGAVDDPQAFAEVSVAARGLFALERLLFEPGMADYVENDYRCALARAISVDLARMADELAQDWRADHAPAMIEADNATYRAPREAQQALYTALTTGLAFNADQRLGQPLGSFDRPRPARAEARYAERSLRNVKLSLVALRDLARALADTSIPQTEAAFETALDATTALDAVFAGVEDPQERLRIEILQQRITAISGPVANEIGAPLGISAGFNATDGD
ncbi:imelysin family protein [Limimaricola litoreus]|uniref:Imelysin family protein n=1 Tax=Limimaricola litoreus TaxID=2955316 RepID=A0A9X2JNG3_9RHOB|nr:imelysin family protein [Limimaricola litoreus]MCP1168358.1 imelysin family protein [Limimaricola litoreus]